MNIRPGLRTAAACLSMCVLCTPAVAQVVSTEQPPGTAENVAASTETYAVDNLGDATFEGATPDNLFLTRHQGRIVGLKFLSNSMDTAVDYGSDSELRSQVYWDEYGLGAYYVALGGSPNVNQIWHTNFTNDEHRQITDGQCITGLPGLSRRQECVYNRPIASSVNRIAFIQEILDYDPDTDGEQIPESVQKQIVIGANGVLRSVRFQKPIPYHMDWSPDGRWLVYTDNGDLAVLVLTDPSKVAVENCPLWDDVRTRIEHPEWVWDGGLWIVYETASDIWRVPVKKPTGKKICPTLQLSRKEQLTDSDYEDIEPQWMNFNNLVAFKSNRPLGDDTSRKMRIWALPLGQAANLSPVVMMPFSIRETDWQRVRETPADQKAKDAIRNSRQQGGK